MRLIDADATIYALNVASRGDSKDVIRNLVICFLLASPTVDAVPVIRCKDCKYFRIYKHTDWTVELCGRIRTTMADPVKEDDYCSKAEREEE